MWLWNEWFNPNSFYSYCVMVPFISGALIYQKISSSGFKWKDLIFPCGFLVFMFPLPHNLTDGLAFNLKFLSAQVASFILNMLQIHSYREGNIIILNHGSVVVNEACSGIRALISLLAIGSVLTYWMKTNKINRFILMFSVIPIALIVNASRIVMLAIVTEFWGAKYTTGIVHNIAGFLLFGFGLFFLLTVRNILLIKSGTNLLHQ